MSFPRTALLLQGLALGLATFAVLMAAFFELVCGMPLDRPLYAAAGAAIAACAVLARALGGVRLSRRGWAVSAAAFGALAVLHLVPWNSRKPFLQRLGQIAIGMSPAEVEAIMAGYLRRTNWEAFDGPVRVRDAMVFRHSDAPEFNSDWGVVRFDAAARVVAVEFLPD